VPKQQSEHPGLTELETRILDAELARPTPPARGAAARAMFPDAVHPLTAYCQILNRLLDRPAARAYAPEAIHRLQAARRRARLARKHT
jgi:hypothetical protein